VDVLAAGISVPTQVLLVSFYGDEILKYLTRFKIVLGVTIATALLTFILYKLAQRQRAARQIVPK
jgi:type IV secretory pathway VirB3-like protein